MSQIQKKKFLLMGKSGAGKTSMRSIIFANYVPRDTQRLGPTIDVEQSHIRFLGDLVLSLWDCGGQDAFMNNFLDAQRENVFNDVEVLIYVFDVESREDEKDLNYFRLCAESIAYKSPNAHVFCLIHKMDLVPEDQRDKIFKEREEAIKGVSYMLKVDCLRTSIWDETLYKAWSSIVCSLVPNINALESRLKEFCTICEADEIVLFERSTFLVIAHATLRSHGDIHRFEKISNIIKQFKLSCNKSRAQFESMQLHNSSLTALINNFTQYTCAMIITSDESVHPAATWINIKNGKDYFEQILENQFSDR